MMLRYWLTAEFAAGAVITLTFVVLYAARSPWRSTAVGRNVMAVMLVLATFFVLLVVHRAVAPLPIWVWVAAMAVLDAVLLWRLLLLWQAQHDRVGGGRHRDR